MQEGQRSGQDVQALYILPRAQLQAGPGLPRYYPDISQNMVGSVENQKHDGGRCRDPERPLERRCPALHRPFLDTEQMCNLVGETAKSEQREKVTGQGQPQAVAQCIDVSAEAGEILAATPVSALKVADHQRYHWCDFHIDC